jgi:hypothetical protein
MQRCLLQALPGPPAACCFKHAVLLQLHSRILTGTGCTQMLLLLDEHH